jgi:hypothetical protein
MQRGAHRRSMLALSVAVGLIGLVGPSPAGAATQIGETFTPAGGSCADKTSFQSGSPGGQYTVPFAGVITAWSHQGGDTPPALKLKVARPEGGDLFTVIGASGLETPVANQLNTYTDVQIPVQPGDVVGFYIAGATDCARMAPDGYDYHITTGDQAPGTTTSYTASTNVQLDIAATLEPDCDVDGFGDETQDPSVLGGTCPLRGRTLTLDASKSKVKKGKKVTLTGRLTEVARLGECQSAQAVQIQRKKPSQSTFTTIEQLQTDAQGNFSVTEKVKKTYEYRAEVVATIGCGGQVSDSEKVKVKRKKK